MQLKRIELKGFKSFAKETIIHFGENVTGIVGPNGSGKSNVVDAIRWVLGEQKSKDLRLESMTDVIFNGTKKKKRSVYAKVTIVFDNNKGVLPSEYSEVAIARKLDQEGNSEYFLNGVACRLKDIRTLLIDTGIGSHSYAIIALGMVDDILADKDGARRKMFEQASGISKFKKRKHQSELKLKSTNADLERIEDLVHELKSQLSSLKRQANRAERYLRIKKDYKERSIALSLHKTKDLTQTYKRLSKTIEEEQDAYRELNKKADQCELELNNKKNKYSSHETKLSTSQRELQAATNRLHSLENEQSIAQQRIIYNQKSISQIADRISHAEERKKEIAHKIEQLQSKIEHAEFSLKEQETQFANLKKKKEEVQSEYSHLDNRRNQQLEQQQESERKILKIEQEIAIAQSSLSSHQRQIHTIQDQLSGIVNDHSEVTRAHSDKVHQIAKLEKNLEELEGSEQSRKDQLLEVEELIEKKHRELAHTRRSHDAIKNEYTLIKDLVEKLEGFPESIKYLSKKDKWIEQAQLFSDILYCKEEYRTAIENYLNPYLSYYVVNNVEHAMKAIEMLKGAQKGKAQFFINSLFENKTEDNIFSPYRAAIDCVEVEPLYVNLISQLLHNVFIVDDKDEKEILALENPGVTFITIDGSAIIGDKKVSGGSVGLFEGNRLGRKKNLEKLNNKLEKLKSQLEEQEETLKILQDEKHKLKSQQKEQDLKKVKLQLEKEYREGQKLALQLDQFNSNKTSLLKSERELQKESHLLASQLEKHKKELSTMQSNYQDIKHEMQKVDTVYASANTLVSKTSEKYNNAHIEYVKKQNHVHSLNNEKEYLENQINSINNEIKASDSDQSKLQRELVSDKNLIQELGTKIIAATTKKSEFKDALDDIEKEYFEEQKILNELRDDLSSFQKKIQQRQYAISELKDQYNQVKLKLSNISERLRVEFELDLNILLNSSDIDFSEELDFDKMDEEVNKLRTKISSFGEVNPMALEAYQEMNERFQLIETQRQDIIDAKESLQKTIKEIEVRATERFMESFDEIRTNFIQVFRTLFTADDSCDLILLDPENPLSSNIEIIAQPKGKKPKSLSQLSGGEKTLTATALLFALYLMKPAPFCIFDEVDAPLDDANLAKFNNIIKEFSKKSQFIIVTHSKHTMAEMDVIYGVYMDEPGISGVSAVDFREFEDKGMFEKAQA